MKQALYSLSTFMTGKNQIRAVDVIVAEMTCAVFTENITPVFMKRKLGTARCVVWWGILEDGIVRVSDHRTGPVSHKSLGGHM